MSGWRGAILKGWTFVTTVNLGTGLPLTPSLQATVPGTGFTCCIRPEYTGQSVTDAPGGRHLNPAAYIAPLPGQWGNAGRDSITGPAQFCAERIHAAVTSPTSGICGLTVPTYSTP